MKKHFSIALILILAVSCIFSASAASFFDSEPDTPPEKVVCASEYPLVSYPSQMFDPSVLCPVIVTDKNYDSLSSSVLFGDIVDLMTQGSIYLLKYDEKGRLYPSLLTDGNYSCYYNHNQYVYAVNNGKDVYRYDITTGEGSLIVSAEKDIDLLYGFDDLVFYSSSGTVYLCPVSGGTPKEIYKNELLKSFFPVTSNVVRVSIPNEFYEECLAHEFTDAVSYYDWFVSQKTAGHQSFSREECVEYLSSHSVDEFLTVLEEIPRDTLLYIDFVNDSVSESFSYSSECLEIYDSFVNEVDSFSLSSDAGDEPTRAITRTYNTGDYFSQTHVECTCHGYLCSCDTTYSGGCDCKLYDGGIQCAGYARYVFHEDNGISYRNGHSISSSSYPSVIGNNAETIAFFTSLHPTVYLWYSAPSTSNHKIAVTSASSSGIYFCQANSGGRCKISNGVSKSYASMAGMNPNSIVEYTSCTAGRIWVSYSAATHAHKCKYCGAFVGPYESHVVNSTQTLCTVCGYTGPFFIIFDE